MPTVRFPNGDTISFPEGTSPEEMKSASDAHWIKVRTGGGELQVDPDAGVKRADIHQTIAPDRRDMAEAEKPAKDAGPGAREGNVTGISPEQAAVHGTIGVDPDRGMIGRARAGERYASILEFYYRGARVLRRY